MTNDSSPILNTTSMQSGIGREVPNRKSAEAVIVLENVCKYYHVQKAVDSISFSVGRGEIFGFLGPNGAGKTTTIKMITTLLRPTQGSIQVCGFDVQKDPLEVKRRIGYMPDVPGFYGEMSAFEILEYYAEFYKIPREVRRKKIDELLTMMHLIDVKDKKIKTFSRGMKQKVGFASALLNDPEVLILDEPTIGLDPETIHLFRTVIRSLNEKGVTIFLSSHILSEVQAICDHVGIIRQGKIIAVDSIQGLSKKVSEKKNMLLIVSYENMTDEAVDVVQQIPGVIRVVNNSEAKKLEVEISPEKASISLINHTLVQHGIGVTGLERKQPDLEDIFLSLIRGGSP
ncbi:MAG: ABC transporter ATP-binding protein [Candidatus Thermoplasmatota archaeon]